MAVAFTTAVALHALWDSTDSALARVAIGTVSGALLAAQIRQVRLVQRPLTQPAAA